MNRVLSHVAMVLLGVSLSVSFYEGRRLVKNTRSALTAASSISSTEPVRRRGADVADAEELEDVLADRAMDEDERGDRKRPRASRGARVALPEVGASVDRSNLVRARQRQRLAGRPGGPTGEAPEVEELEEAEVDTGLAAAPR